MHKATLTELSAALAGKQISSVELTRLFLDRIERHNAALNAFITVDADKSLAQAAAADARIAAGGAGRRPGLRMRPRGLFGAEG